jgi:hypothetical protein
MAISSLTAIASAMSYRTSAPSTRSITLKEMLDLLHRNQRHLGDAGGIGRKLGSGFQYTLS